MLETTKEMSQGQSLNVAEQEKNEDMEVDEEMKKFI